jgi:2-C-methyl-D-erythritol 4-phosphate cytidylyltransferase
MQKYVVIVAGGSGTRMKREIPKQFIPVAGKPILMHTLDAFYQVSSQINIILVLPESQLLGWKSLCAQYNFTLPHITTTGGKTRFHSVKNGLAQITGQGLVAIHDGVRPLVTPKIILNSFAMAEKQGNAVTAVALKDSIRWAKESENKVVNRNEYQLIQTPQTFRVSLIKKAFEQDYDPRFTDDATVLEATGAKINLIEGDYSNIKITTPEDLIVAGSLLKQQH